MYSNRLQPGELVRIFYFNGKKYVRIAFTNRVKINGTIPMTDILMDEVTGIRKLPSPFKKGICNLIGIKARATYYKMQRLNG